MNNQLYVLTAIFNPFRFKSRARLYRDFAKHMKDTGATLITIEAAFGVEPHEVTDPQNPHHIQLRTDQIVWHKERMLNLARAHVLHLYPDARNFAWIDADVTFTNHNWVDETVHKLSYLHVLQPFGVAVNMDSSEHELWNCPSSFRSFVEGRGYHQTPPLPVSYTYKGHPGLAWCATREVLDAMNGLYDRCIAGSADTIISNALKGDWQVYLPGAPSKAMIDSIQRWAENAYRAARGQIGYVRGSLMHHWHGYSEARGYEKRWDIMSYHQFDPIEDIVEDPVSGLFRWAGNKPALEADIRLSLGSRNEDAL